MRVVRPEGQEALGRALARARWRRRARARALDKGRAARAKGGRACVGQRGLNDPTQAFARPLSARAPPLLWLGCQRRGRCPSGFCSAERRLRRRMLSRHRSRAALKTRRVLSLTRSLTQHRNTHTTPSTTTRALSHTARARSTAPSLSPTKAGWVRENSTEPTAPPSPKRHRLSVQKQSRRVIRGRSCPPPEPARAEEQGTRERHSGVSSPSLSQKETAQSN